MVLKERGRVCVEKMKLDECREISSGYPDFAEDAKTTMLTEYLGRNGAECYYIPKYHCELNPTEPYWG